MVTKKTKKERKEKREKEKKRKITTPYHARSQRRKRVPQNQSSAKRTTKRAPTNPPTNSITAQPHNKHTRPDQKKKPTNEGRKKGERKREIKNER